MRATRYLTYAATALGATALAGPAFAANTDAPTYGTATAIESEAHLFQVFFPLDSAELDVDSRQEVVRAADDWKAGGSGTVSVIGHSDTSGAADYNLKLSEQRARAVEAVLLREGVPPGQIDIVAEGQDDLLVPTSDGVREDQNRRVEIVIPAAPLEVKTVEVAPPPPEPLPAASAPATPAPEADAGRFTFALGPVYGHNFGENDDGADDDLVGAELRFQALPGFLGGVSLSQMGLWAFNTNDEGFAGRTVASLDFAPDLGIFQPALALNGGVVYGDGVQDGFVVGPEIRFNAVPFAGFKMGLKVAYDYQFEADDWDQGILWGGVDLGIRF